MTTVLRRMASAFGALALLLILTIGVPLMLWHAVGWPLPSSIPTLESVTDGLTNQAISDDTVVKVVAAVGWLAWTQIFVSIIAETSAWLRCRPARHMTLAGPFQPTVRKLIATVALLVSTNTAPGLTALAMAAPPPASKAPTAAVIHVDSSPMMLADSTAEAVPVAEAVLEAEHGHEYVVQKRDTLWGLAERHLGDPLRWREIFDLNEGRPQPAGRTLSDPNLIVIGWTLLFPVDAVGFPAIVSADNDPAAIAEEPQQGVATACEQEPDHRANQPPSSTIVDNADQAVPLAPAAPPPAPLDTAPSPTEASPGSTHDPVDNEASSRAPYYVGGSLLAAGLVVLLNRLRRARLRRRLPGQRLPRPDPLLEDAELSTRATADLEGASRLDLALRAFAHGIATPAPVVQAVRIDDEQVELLLDRPLTNPPAGFTVAGNPRAVITTPELTHQQLIQLANGAAAPLPALVTIGEADGDPVLIDLEMARLLSVDGDPDTSADMIRRMATELATGPWIDHVQIITTGDLRVDLPGTHRVRHVEDPYKAVHELWAVGIAMGSRLGELSHDSTLPARCSAQVADGWIPTILFSTRPLPADLDGTFPEARGIAVVAPQLDGAEWSATIDGDVLRLLPLGMTLTPLPLNEPLLDEFDQLLTDAAMHAPAGLMFDTSPADPSRLEPAAPRMTEEFEIEVAVLGPIEIRGANKLDRRRPRELIAYLAIHTEGATDERLKTVLWPDKAPTAGTFNTTVSMARTALGLNRDGEPHFPHVGSTGKYQLAETVTTDLARFEAMIDSAKDVASTERMDVLRSALALVRGEPFDDTAGYHWTFTEGHAHATASVVSDTAHALAALAFQAGDLELVEWAARQGLKTSPGDETLYRDRMQAAHTAGKPERVRKLFEELCRVVETDDPAEDLQDSTIEWARIASGTGTIRRQA